MGPTTRAVVVAVSDAPATAAALVRDKGCTPQCLVASDPDDTGSCGCPCKGAHHGKLAHALVPGTRREHKPPAPADVEPGLFPAVDTATGELVGV